MSQLNLTPDPVLLATQATIFLANMLVVKKLILNPYLAVRSRREAATGGSQDEAQNLSREALVLEVKITERMRQAHKDAAAAREKIKSAAMTARSKRLARAESEAKEAQTAMEQEITKNLNEERSKKDATIKTIADAFFAQVAH
jgi:F0F1-type ATP synthase membrane subunit b/b'